jgi:sortase A
MLMLADAGLTVVWQEPFSAIYGSLTQRGLRGDLHRLDRERPTGVQARALAALRTESLRMAFLARALRRSAKEGSAVGRLSIPAIGSTHVMVKGTGTAALRKGPGVYDRTVFPGTPGTVGVAGHRTTYLAPFRRINELKHGSRVVIEMPYGRFVYAVYKTRIVPPTQVSVLDRVGFDELVMSACHPLYSAAKRIVVFARLMTATPRGAARLPSRS